MNKKLASVRKYVQDNRTYLAFCAGSIVTSSVILLTTKDKTLLAVTKDQHMLMKMGGSIKYELKDQTLYLVDIAAVEAKNVIV